MPKADPLRSKESALVRTGIGSFFANRTTLRVIFAVNVVLAALQVYHALRQGTAWSELGIPPWLKTYLIFTGALKLILYLLALFSLRVSNKPPISIAWAAVGATILSYWIEYFFLWSPEQKATKPVFTMIIHLILVLALALFSYNHRQKERTHGSGNRS